VDRRAINNERQMQTLGLLETLRPSLVGGRKVGGHGQRNWEPL
jgi:hypothetical protein